MLFSVLRNLEGKTTVRLSPEQVQSIREVAAEIFGPEAQVWLFGSRVDDNLRGGDVDLLVESPEPVEDSVWKQALFAAQLERRFDGRKVDVLLRAPNLLVQPIHESARRTGVRL
jgi:predicted nucleotidyltransferase